MTKRKGIRLLAALALCFTLCISFTVPAFAYADDTEQELPVTEATQPEATPETAAPEEPEPYEGEPIDGEGNAYTRDLLYDKATNKQFITVQTKTGNTFYVVIDYDAPINEEEEQYQTYFLNMVDEADLLALMDEEDIPEPEPEPAPTPEPEPLPEPEPEEGEDGAGKFVLVLLVLAGIAGGGAYFWLKMQQQKREAEENKPDPDADYREDEEEIVLPEEEPEREPDEDAERKAYQDSDGYEEE